MVAYFRDSNLQLVLARAVHLNGHARPFKRATVGKDFTQPIYKKNTVAIQKHTVYILYLHMCP